VNKNTLQRTLLISIAILVAPFTFIWSKGRYSQDFGLDAVSDGISYSLDDPITTASAAVYLAVLFAFLVKRNLGLRSLLITLAFIFELWMIQSFALALLVINELSLGRVLSLVFYRTDKLFPWQVLNSIGIVFLTILVFGERSWIKYQTKYLFDKVKSSPLGIRRFSDKTYGSERASIPLMLIVVILIVARSADALSNFNEARKAFSAEFHLELVCIALAYVLGIFVPAMSAFLLSTYVIKTFDAWRNELSDLNRNLTDFRLSKYITRLIAGYLYWLYAVVVVAIFALVAPIQTIAIYEQNAPSFDSGFNLELLVLIIVVPLFVALIAFLVVLLLRLVFEVLIATIHIAQNTTSKTQLNKP
jgi:Domain of unknown function (DUF4282)